MRAYMFRTTIVNVSLEIRMRANLQQADYVSRQLANWNATTLVLLTSDTRSAYLSSLGHLPSSISIGVAGYSSKFDAEQHTPSSSSICLQLSRRASLASAQSPKSVISPYPLQVRSGTRQEVRAGLQLRGISSLSRLTVLCGFSSLSSPPLPPIKSLRILMVIFIHSLANLTDLLCTSSSSPCFAGSSR